MQATENQITPRQQEVLDTIRALRDKHGYSPTNREIGEAMGFTSASALNYVRILEHAGKLRVTRNISRSIVVL